MRRLVNICLIEMIVPKVSSVKRPEGLRTFGTVSVVDNLRDGDLC